MAKTLVICLICLFITHTHASAQEEAWKMDARNLLSSIQTMTLQHKFQPINNRHYVQSASFSADSGKQYVVVYLYEGAHCELPSLTVIHNAKDSSQNIHYSVRSSGLVYQSASSMLIKLEPPRGTMLFKIETPCLGAIHIFVKN